MKRLILASLVAILPFMAIASPQNQSNAPLPRSVFEKTGRDPFARPDKKKPVESIVNEKPVYSLSLNFIGIAPENGKRKALISGVFLTEGETGSIKAGKTGIEFVCKEIRADGVLIQIGTNSRVKLGLGSTLQVDEQGTARRNKRR